MSSSLQNETGMLDVGTHCAYCRQIDFLPFHCSYCNKDFCTSHRFKEAHRCEWLLEHQEEVVEVTPSPPKSNGGISFFKSLLPDKSYIRVQKAQEEATQPIKTIKSTLNQSSLEKLLKFFKKRQSSKHFRSKTTSSNKIVKLSQLKKTAIGDSKIPNQNRIYLYATVIGDTDTKENIAIYINKVWPLGRVLDSIAHLLQVKNNNAQFSTTQDEKLFLYKFLAIENQLVQLNTSDRVTDNLHDTDNVYIIRGSETK